MQELEDLIQQLYGKRNLISYHFRWAFDTLAILLAILAI